ncbi:MAG: M15 family metallopeptidase [Lysobacter sp.]|nr:M15 family metallopeptidase [Lysobacter sp.]
MAVVRPLRIAVLLGATLAVAACVSASPSPAAAAPVAPQLSTAADPTAAGMLDLRELVPDLALEIRYAGSDNFVGRPVAGYGAPRCYLLRTVALALQRVETSLRREGLRLKIFDCYRPARAVADFVAWAGDLDDQSTKAAYYPNLAKRALLGDYISPTSGHSRGATLDLSLMRCASADDASTCTALDMGTPFDYFDVSAHTDWPGATSVQRENRQRLLTAMAREGFANYPLEWWHYTYKPEPTPHTAYDFPLR